LIIFVSAFILVKSFHFSLIDIFFAYHKYFILFSLFDPTTFFTFLHHQLFFSLSPQQCSEVLYFPLMFFYSFPQKLEYLDLILRFIELIFSTEH